MQREFSILKNLIFLFLTSSICIAYDKDISSGSEELLLCEKEIDRLIDCDKIKNMGPTITLSNGENVRNVLYDNSAEIEKAKNTATKIGQEKLAILSFEFEKQWKKTFKS